MESLVSFYRGGGVLMHVIAAIGVLGLGVVLERCWVLVVCERGDARGLFAAVEERWLARDSAAALELCRGRGTVAEVLRAGLMEGVERRRARLAVQEVQGARVYRLQQRLPWLSALANLAGLCGLLGTVLGMGAATGCVATADATARAMAWARGVSVVFHTTGFGVAVAIGLRFAGLVLAGWRDRLLGECALYGARVVALVGRGCEAEEGRRGGVYRGV